METFGEMRRGLTVLKMRGSRHDKEIREFTIDDSGMHIGRPFRGVSGILSGHFNHAASNEVQRINELFQDERTTARPTGPGGAPTHRSAAHPSGDGDGN